MKGLQLFGVVRIDLMRQAEGLQVSKAQLDEAHRTPSLAQTTDADPDRRLQSAWQLKPASGGAEPSSSAAALGPGQRGLPAHLARSTIYGGSAPRV